MLFFVIGTRSILFSECGQVIIFMIMEPARNVL